MTDDAAQPLKVDLTRAAEIALTARQDTSAGLVAREQLVPMVGDMVAEIGALRETVTAYREDLEDVRAEVELARRVRLAPAPGQHLIDNQVHTPARVRAYLIAKGYVCERQHARSTATTN